jgi:hypothetical protein
MGADLENRQSVNSGWKAVIASNIRRQDQAAMFKIPHHGSQNAQSLAVWDAMVAEDGIAVLTPYTPSGVPKVTEIEWLKNRGRRVFATGLPKSVRVRRRREVEKTAQETTRKLQSFEVPRKAGVVRFRKSAGAWRAELFGSAVKL